MVAKGYVPSFTCAVRVGVPGDASSVCPDDEHDVDESRAPYVCRRCGQPICAGCGRAFDLMCNACDEIDPPSDG